MLDTIAYHGTDAARFNRFDLRRAGSATDEGLLGRGVYLSTDPAIARNRRFCITARVRLENPLALSMPSWAASKSRLASDALDLDGVRSGASLTRAAKAAGYDGVVLDYSELGYYQQEIVAFDSGAVSLLDHRDSCLISKVSEVSVQLTGTQLDVLRLIAEGHALGDYVPRYRPGARRGRGAFPVTIATRAAVQLVKKGLVVLDSRSPNGYALTEAGAAVLAGRVTKQREGMATLRRPPSRFR